MIKDIEFFFKSIFFSEKYLLEKRLKRAVKKNYEKELSIIDTFKDDDKDAIDVGVYRGVYSYELSKKFKHVHSFEPNPILFPYLKKNLTKIIKNMTLYNYALSKENIFTNLKIPRRGKSIFNKNIEEIYKLGCATIHEKNNFENYTNYKVECKKLDDVINDKKIGFIKIDVEGHELSVIQGAMNTINKYKPVLLVEIEEKHTKKPVIETVKYITNLGYDIYHLENNSIKKILNEKIFLNERNFIFIKV